MAILAIILSVNKTSDTVTQILPNSSEVAAIEGHSMSSDTKCARITSCSHEMLYNQIIVSNNVRIEP